MTKVEYYQSIFDNQIHYARNEGREEGKIEFAKKLLKRNRPLDEIAEDTGLTYEEVEGLLANNLSLPKK